MKYTVLYIGYHDQTLNLMRLVWVVPLMITHPSRKYRSEKYGLNEFRLGNKPILLHNFYTHAKGWNILLYLCILFMKILYGDRVPMMLILRVKLYWSVAEVYIHLYR